MNTFYYKYDVLFDNKKDAKEFANNFIDNTISTVYTDNDFVTFTNRFKLARSQYNDILTSLDYAVKYESDEDFLNVHWLY